MMDWENLRHFVALARAGTLSGAARALGVEHATIARRTAALEAQLDLKLVDRRGRRLELTAEGRRIAAMADRMEHDALAIQRAAQGARTELVGQIVISAPPVLAARMLVQGLIDLRRRHPRLDIGILGETQSASLNRREADIAIRLSRPTAGELRIVKLAEIGFRLYGSPSYLARVRPGDWAFIGYERDMDAAMQQAVMIGRMAGRSMAFRASTLEIQCALASRGGGVAMLPDFMAADDPGLIVAAPEEAPVMREVWLVTHADTKNSAAVRAVVSAIRACFEPHARV